MKIIGHRGSVDLGQPENSLAAAAAALDAGADGIEVDVRITADGVAVCVHDKSLLRVAGVDIEPERSAYADVSGMRCGDVPIVPTLRQVRDMLAAGTMLVAEIKPTAHDPDATVAATLRALDGRPEVVITSFEPPPDCGGPPDDASATHRHAHAADGLLRCRRSRRAVPGMRRSGPARLQPPRRPWHPL